MAKCVLVSISFIFQILSWWSNIIDFVSASNCSLSLPQSTTWWLRQLNEISSGCTCSKV